MCSRFNRWGGGESGASRLLTCRRQNENGWTALHHATYNGNLKLAWLLLESGADRAANSECGETARDLAVQEKPPAVAALAVTAGSSGKWARAGLELTMSP